MKIKIYPPTPPIRLLSALEKCRLKYSTPVTLFRLVELGDDIFCGVFGDGGNATYEWFVWSAGKLETSDSGYGGTDSALRDALIKALE